MSIRVDWANAARWLTNTFQYRGARSDTQGAMHLLLAGWLTYHYGAIDAGKQLCHELAQRLDEVPSNLLTEVDPLLVTICAGILQRLGMESAPLQTEVSNLARQIEAERKTELSRDLRHPRVLLLRECLAGLGLSQHPERTEVLAYEPPSATMLLSGDTEALALASDWMAVLTGFGEAPPIASERLAGLKEIWPDVLVVMLREYRLEVAGQMARAAHYMHWLDQELQDEVVDFFALQQRSNGAFGYINPFRSGLKGQDIGFDFYFLLPVTISSLWTLGELLFGRSLLLWR